MQPPPDANPRHRRMGAPLLDCISVAAVALSLAGPAAVRSPAAARAERAGDAVAISNELLHLSIALDKGARITVFEYKPFQENVIYPAESAGGLLMDHVWEQTWPGEFLNRRYEAEIVKSGPDEASVKVWTTGAGETVKGLRFERLITVRDGDRNLYVTVSIMNPTEEGRVTGYWSQNNYWFGNRKEGFAWARPAVRGIDRLGIDEKGEPWFGGAWYYIDDATAGWNGGYHSNLRRGMMFLMDYNDLWRIYDNAAAVTTEWMYDRVAIPAGKAWSTDIVVIPVSGITGFCHGSRYLVANMEVARTNGSLIIEHQLARGVEKVEDITLETRVWGLKAAWTGEVDKVRVPALEDDARSFTVVARNIGPMPAGIEVTMTGKDANGRIVRAVYGDYYGGAEGKNNDPFTMKPYLSFARPPKQKKFLKPDVISYKPHEPPSVLHLRGLWASQFRFEEAVSNCLPAAAMSIGWLESSPVGLTFTWFPPDYPSLLSHDLIVLGNVPAAPFDLVGQEMLKDYIAAGGNVLMLGGDQSYGQAGFSNTELLELLPVDVGSPYNWRRLERGTQLTVCMPQHPVADGVVFDKQDRVFYSHLCAPRQGAEVILKAGDRPILVLGRTPAGGRIACVLATPFGEADRNERAFWDSPAWQRLMVNTVKWLLHRLPG